MATTSGTEPEPPIPRRCILHVGAPKTGTTYLQDVLWGSTAELREQGFRMPLRNVQDHFFLTLDLRGRLDPAMDPPGALDVLERFRRDLQRPGTEHLIVSHELLAAVEQDRIDEFLELLSEFEVHVVVTARDLARQVPAEWQQHVKTRSELTYGTFVTNIVSERTGHFWAVQDVASVAERWGRSLPAEQVHIVTVPPAGTSLEELLTRFCAAVGLDPTKLRRDQVRLNKSIGYEQTELVRRINVALGNRLPHPRQGYNGTVKFWFAEELLSAQQPRQRLVLPAHRWDWCVDVSREIVERIETAGYEVNGNLADLMPSLAATADLYPPTDADVAAAAVEAIAAMLDDRHRRNRRLARQEAGIPGPPPGRPLPIGATTGVADRLRGSAVRLARRVRG